MIIILLIIIVMLLIIMIIIIIVRLLIIVIMIFPDCFERFAEYGWKPRRGFTGSKKRAPGLVFLVYAWKN